MVLLFFVGMVLRPVMIVGRYDSSSLYKRYVLMMLDDDSLQNGMLISIHVVRY